MRKINFVVLIGILSILISACSSSQDLPITPVPDKLTFLFFYTEGWVPWKNMMPIVDGLEEKYQGEVAFMRLNAARDDGRDTFRYYNLPGHPSFVLLNPSGDVLWLGSGEQSADLIEAELIVNISQIDLE